MVVSFPDPARSTNGEGRMMVLDTSFKAGGGIEEPLVDALGS